MNGNRLQFPVTDELHGLLEAAKVSHGAIVAVLESSYKAFEGIVRAQHAELSEAEQHALTVCFCLTHPDHKQKHFELNHPVVSLKDKLVTLLNREDVTTLGRWVFKLAVVVLLGVLAAHAQHGTSRIDVIQWQHSNNSVANTYSAPFKIKEGLNVTFTPGTCPGADCGKMIIAASSTAATAWSAITAAINSNAGTFGMSGNTLDLTAATLVKLRVAGGLTASTNGDLGYDSTANMWRIWQSAADQFLVASTNKPTADCVPIGNSDGTTTCGDPLVQGTQAAGSTTIPNPVVDGGSDYGGTPVVRALKVDSLGNIYVGNFPATQPISAVSLPLPTGAATAAKQPALGTAGTPSADVITVQGKASMTPLLVDGSGVTQPVSGTVTATQATGTNLHMVCDSGCSSSAGFADNGAFTTGTTAINPVGGDFDDTPPTAITTGHAAAARITPNRAIHINLRNQAGTEIGTSSNPVRVDPTGATTQPISAASLPLPTGAAADSSLTTLDTDVKSNITLHAGTNLIGKAGFDGTTPGSTNGVTQFQPSRTTGTITSAASTVSVGTAGYGVATVTVNGTYAGVTVNFEFSDDSGTTWYTETCTRTDVSTQENSEALPSNQTRAWDCGVFAATNFRVRSSAFTSGTANIGITLSAAPIEPAQTVSVSGTVPVSCANGATCPTNATLQSGSAIVGKVTTDQTTHGTTDLVAADITKYNGSAVGTANPVIVREGDGTNLVTLDPCRVNANSFAKISQTTNTQVITGTSAKKTYICAINLVTAGANNVAIVEGTGTVCATGIAGVSTGGTTAATGWNFAANDGLTQGNGMGSVMAANNANADNVCILQSAAVQLSGVIAYVQQ